MMYDEIFERLEGQVVVEVADAKGGGLAILFDDGPTILVVGGDNATMCLHASEHPDNVSWEIFWNNVREGGAECHIFEGVREEKEGGVVIMPE